MSLVSNFKRCSENSVTHRKWVLAERFIIQYVSTQVQHVQVQEA